MTLTAADEFFLDNGGRALLEAHGVTENLSLAAYFSRRLPTFATAEKESSTSTPMTAGGPGTLLIWNGGMEAYVNTDPGRTIPGVKVQRFLSEKALGPIVLRALDLPRPIMMLTVGLGYSASIAKAEISLDPDSIIVSGSMGVVLDRDRIERIRKGCARYGVAAYPLRRLVEAYEGSISQGTRITPAAERQAIAFLKKLKIDPTPDELRKLWKNVDQMPASADYAWTVADAAIAAAQ